MTRLRVLIVEDVDDDAALLLRELRRAYEVDYVRVDTVPALRTELHGRQWDVVITDFSLPTMGAMDTLHVVTTSGLDVPCIVLSGTVQEESAVEVMKAGASDFISKERLARLLPAISRELREAGQRQERRLVQQALDEAKGRARFALEAAGVGTWEWDFSTGHIIWTDVLERLHGLQPGTFGGTYAAYLDLIHPEERTVVRDQIDRSIRERTESRLEYRTTWTDGSIHWVATVGHNFYGDEGQPLRSAGIALDVTAQKRLEEQFRQAQRMESIGNLAGGIAHDFNNLLTAILGYSDSLLEDLPLDEESMYLRKGLQEIRNAGQRAAALTGQLLAFSRKQIVQLKVLSLNTIVSGIEPMLRRLVGEDIELMTHLGRTIGSVNADVSQLEQVIMNLVVNARDAMPRGGKITLETTNVDLDEAYARTHISVVPGRYVMLAVSDTGSGMTPDVQARIFEPFFTTKPKGRGTGLGLATIFGIVKQSHGNIWVYSEPDKGTTFKVYLPRVDKAAESTTVAAAPRASRGDETVLLVEDDELVRKLAREILNRNGYKVLVASEAEEAMMLAATHEGGIDLLLTDVVMPGTSGRVLAQRLLQDRGQLKVLYMSGYTDNAIVDHGVLTPDVAFLQKPFTPASFSRAVRDVLDAGSSSID